MGDRFVGRAHPIRDEHDQLLAVAHVRGYLSAQASVALTELANAVRAQDVAEDPDGFRGDSQRRALARVRGETLPDCGRVGGWHLVCTRPAGHLPAEVHAVANGAHRWVS